MQLMPEDHYIAMLKLSITVIVIKFLFPGTVVEFLLSGMVGTSCTSVTVVSLMIESLSCWVLRIQKEFNSVVLKSVQQIIYLKPKLNFAFL